MIMIDENEWKFNLFIDNARNYQLLSIDNFSDIKHA